MAALLSRAPSPRSFKWVVTGSLLVRRRGHAATVGSIDPDPNGEGFPLRGR